MKKNVVKGFLFMLVTVLVFGALAYVLNIFTGPLIEKNNQGAELAPLKEVMPDAEGFEAMYKDGDTSLTVLSNVPSQIVPEGAFGQGSSGKFIGFYKETSGKGFVFRFSMSTTFSSSPMEYTVGVTTDGKISGIKENSYNDSKSVGADFVNSFIGNDSALANVELVATVTYSSTAIKAAVECGLKVLIDNNMITAGVKTPEQLLTELVSKVHPGMTKFTTAPGTNNIETIMTASNNSGFAYIMKKGEEKLLAVCNSFGVCKVYNTEGLDVTIDNEVLVSEAIAHSTANQKSFYDESCEKFVNIMPGAENFEEFKLGTFNSVTSCVTFDVEGVKYYGFSTRNIGWTNSDVVNILTGYYVLDSEGKIAKMVTTPYFYDDDHGSFEEYMFDMPSGYADRFNNLNQESFLANADQVVLLTGATISQNAIKVATTDVFDAYKSLNLGGND